MPWQWYRDRWFCNLPGGPAVASPPIITLQGSLQKLYCQQPKTKFSGELVFNYWVAFLWISNWWIVLLRCVKTKSTKENTGHLGCLKEMDSFLVETINTILFLVFYHMESVGSHFSVLYTRSLWLYGCFNPQALYPSLIPVQFVPFALKLKRRHYPSLMENEVLVYFMLGCQFAINTFFIIKTDVWCPSLSLQGFSRRHTYLVCVSVYVCWVCVWKLMADLSNCLKGIFFIYPRMKELLNTHFLPVEDPRSQPTNPTNQRDSLCIYHSNIWHT